MSAYERASLIRRAQDAEARAAWFEDRERNLLGFELHPFVRLYLLYSLENAPCACKGNFSAPSTGQKEGA